MFVPEWPSTGDHGQQEHNNPSGSGIEPGKEISVGAEMNHDLNGFDPFGLNKDTSDQTNIDAIELTHDQATGITSVTKEDSVTDAHLGEEEGDAMDQCAMWNASLPNEDKMDINHDIHTNNATVLSSFGGGDIWSTEAFAFESPLKDLLDSNNFRLVDLLAQDELLQELRGCEARLIEYFSKPEVVAGLVECMICEIPYKNEERGKERWCREELERRAQVKEEMQRSRPAGSASFNESNDDVDSDCWRERHAPTVLATDETNNDPHIEASWNSPVKIPSFMTPEHELAIEEQRSPEEEYDLRYVRYPYMACEVLCSDVGATLDVLVNGYEHIIDDDDDSLLNYNTGGVRMQETKNIEEEEIYDNISVYLDEKPNCDVSLEPTLNEDQQLGYSQQLNPPPTPRNKRTPQRRILDLLFSVLIDTPSSCLDDRRAGYFEKILVLLFRKHSQTMSDYMNTSYVVTSKSAEVAKHLLCTEESTNNEESAYVSLLPSLDSLGSEDGCQILPSTLNQTFTSSNLLPLSSVHTHAPPMLMCALFDHLHSHSIMHIIQRLLIPSTARQQKSTKEVQDETVVGCDTDNPNSAINHQFMNNISQINDAGKQNQSTNVDDDEMADDDLENALNHLFQCDWPAQPSHALELLLSRLEGNTEPFLLKFKFPVGYNEFRSNEDRETLTNDSEKYDAKLSCSQHASEILISIIQNSPLDSPVLISLSSEQCLSRILELMNEPQVFTPHETIMTYAMTVLENLILQLGGYGAVSTPAVPCTSGVQSPSSPPPSLRDTDKSFSLTELGPHTPATSPSAAEVIHSAATPAALIRHLPGILEELSALLVHPATKMWTIPTQYTHCEPRPILGTVRLRILRLIESLVFLGDPTVDLLLQQSDCLECCLDLFWNFEWCSMLHQTVSNLLVHVFEGGNRRARLQDYFIVRCRLLEKLMDSFSDDCFAADAGSGNEELKENKAENGTDDKAKIESSAEFDDNLIAMKILYQDHVTSSIESLDGSESDSSLSGRRVDTDDGDAVPYVSEDDVESALEKEEQDKETTDVTYRLASVSNNSEHHTRAAEVLCKSRKTIPIAESRKDEKFSFRRGYMGHVIIICQAVANACNKVLQTNDDSNPLGISKEEEPLQNHPMTQHSSQDAEFECAAFRTVTDGNSPKSLKRKDRSPVRIGDDTEPISPITETPSTPYEVESLTQSSLDYHWRQEMNVPHILLTLRQHPLFDKWQSFTASTLASEIMVQSSPLGGQHMTKDSGASVGSDSKNRFITVIDDDSDNDFLGGDHGVFSGIAIGEIDMDENDLDIAAQMMDSLSLGPSSGDAGPDPQPIGHNRRNHVIGGGMRLGSEENMNVQERNIGNFGSLIQSNSSLGTKEYVYDDPLGRVRPFENDDSSDEDDMAFPPNSSNVCKGSSEFNKTSLNKSGSTDEDEEEEDDDDIPRVMDLFTGNFSDNFADNPPAEGFNSDDVGWANFDDAFALDDAFTGRR
ncbi:hypothetical protein HJC23_010274 [Cyclotella cryptica]|uniref:Uncharacterized protein n=1 Tax=Cyclotella cryptica TaxID=29204 RepID=A0ABD3QV53_9STRA|eukprot:CCRYP_003658-RA/>CCRYP_003658-RA protein AED:0.05 eAED:0.05 QI:190/1/1/1/0/0/2/281/1477